jgi:hypothetical protein
VAGGGLGFIDAETWEGRTLKHAAQRNEAANRTPRTTADFEPLDQPGARRRPISVGSVNDPAERDADRLAAQALAISRSYRTDDSTPATAMPVTGDAATVSDPIHRSAAAGHDRLDDVSLDHAALEQASTQGRPLDANVIERMEHGLGADLGDVRIHTGSQADSVARSIHAEAFAHGRDVFFSDGAYQPGTTHGDHVLAHELAHTVQDSSSDAVHRFPASWATSPVPWKGLTGSVFRPGEGASGGVYILTTNQPDGAVKKVVAKPIFGSNGLGLKESGEQMAFSDKALGDLLGLRSPVSRIVNSGGTEFAHLVEVCTPKQPQPTTDEEREDFVPLSAAQGFVVMSEVPNATSVAGLAEKAGTDKRAGADLYRTVFDSVFLAELGQLCIGDLMLGNPDRMVLGAMNLGNVMLSMQDGTGQLAAIDTTAYLPKVMDPSEVAKEVKAQGGFNSLKRSLDKGPAYHLDAFFEVLVARIKNSTPGGGDPSIPPAWEVIETTYAANRNRFLASFEYGWQDAMITALSLSMGDGSEVDRVGAGFDDDDTDTTSLKSNLAYIGERAQGKSHEESVGRSIGMMAAKWMETVDHDRMTPPRDELDRRTVAAPSGKALKADVVDTGLLSPTLFKHVAREYGVLEPKPYEILTSTPGFVESSRRRVDQEVSPTKLRKKGLFKSKSEEPRNRSVVSHFVVDATAAGFGAARIADSLKYLRSVSIEVDALRAGVFDKSTARSVAGLMESVDQQARTNAAAANRWESQVRTAKSVLPKTNYQRGPALVAGLGLAEVSLQRALEEADKLKAMDLRSAASRIRASA